MRHITLFLLLTLVIFLQISFWPAIFGFVNYINWVVLLLILLQGFLTEKQLLYYAFSVGLLYDLLAGQTLGTSSLIWIVVILVSVQAKKALLKHALASWVLAFTSGFLTFLLLTWLMTKVI